jgi:hypothetical protein
MTGMTPPTTSSLRKEAAMPILLHFDTMRAMESWCGRLCCLMAALASCFDYRAGLTRTLVSRGRGA